MTLRRLDVRIEHLVLTGIPGDPSAVVDELRGAFAAGLAESMAGATQIVPPDAELVSVVHVPPGATAAAIGRAVGTALSRAVR